MNRVYVDAGKAVHSAGGLFSVCLVHSEWGVSQFLKRTFKAYPSIGPFEEGLLVALQHQLVGQQRVGEGNMPRAADAQIAVRALDPWYAVLPVQPVALPRLPFDDEKVLHRVTLQLIRCQMGPQEVRGPMPRPQPLHQYHREEERKDGDEQLGEGQLDHGRYPP